MSLRLNNTVPINTTVQFLGTGSVQTWTVPQNVFGIRFFMWGAGGAGTGGTGGYVEGTISTTPGQTLQIIVGRSGQTGLANGGPGTGTGAGAGGGFTGIFSGSPAVGTVIAIAGGGGGGGYQGGSGGFPSGTAASVGNGGWGGGGTQTTGGAAGAWEGSIGQVGTQLQGGNASTSQSGGGGGGGGWWGGGGGSGPVSIGYAGGGGGGSSTYISRVLSPVATVGLGGTTNPYYVSPLGAATQNGLLVIGFTSIPPQMRLSNQTVITQTARFLSTGAVQTWTVPPGVFNIKFFLWGAGGTGQNGGQNVSTAGGGGFVEGNLVTSPGTTYSIVVGARGAVGTSPSIANGGAAGGGTGAGGGGFSGIFSSTPAANTVIAIAGGGGGSGFNGNGFGGGGGFPNGSGGVAAGTGSQGGGGTQSSGGTGSYPGSQFLGGIAGFGGDCCGGGGGGGWYGGGGGNNAGGGGGGSSTFISSVINPDTRNGVNGSSSGTIPTPPGGNNSPYWVSPFGSAGQTGLVVIGYSVTAPVNPAVFSYTGSYQTYTVGASTTSVYVYMWGAGGSGNNQGVNGGAGAFLSGILAVTPGEVLRLIVGKGGVPAGQNATDAQGSGGSSLGSANSAQGGGRSAIQRGSGSSYTEIVTVGGGGGAGYYTYNGGAGSFTSQGHRGGDQSLTFVYSTLQAGGGGPDRGGQGAWGKTASDGVQFRGGDVILSYGNPNGGGGGGGWYGGGGGSGGTPGEGGPGGGGSSYTANLTGVSGEDSPGRPAPGTSSQFYPSGSTIAQGGISNTQNGGDGRVVIVPLQLPSPISMISPRVGETTLQAFTATGAVQSYVVPAGVTTIKIYAWGAGGGNANTGGGGGGGFVSGAARVTPGETLYIVVGTVNTAGSPSLATGGGGGIAGKYYGGGGGGFSGVFRNATPQQGYAICMAGGGGSGNNTSATNVPLAGGPGGYPNGLPGQSATGRTGGTGATQIGPGTGGASGSAMFGGNGSTTASDDGYVGGAGSGGGGWFGGGASVQNRTNAGGGGGSGFIGGLFGFVQTENGSYPPTPSGTANAGGESNQYWQSPLGRSTQNGYVVITRFQT
jgi:hypothetical protein